MGSKTPKADASKDKLNDLRDSGHTGGVDQNGNKADAGTQAILDALRDNT